MEKEVNIQNEAPLTAEGCHPAVTATCITCPEDTDAEHRTRAAEEGNVSFVTDITNGTVLGFDKFVYENVSMILLEIRGEFDGSVRVSHTPRGRRAAGEAIFQLRKDSWTCELIPVEGMSGVRPLYFIFSGTGHLDLKQFGFIRV